MSRRALVFVAGFLVSCGSGWADELKDRTYFVHTGAVNAVAVSPDGKFVASAGVNMTVNIWNVEKWVGEQLPAQSAGWSIAFSADGKRVAYPASDNTVRVYDAKTRKQIHSLSGHTQLIWAVAWSPDGKTLASTSVDNTIRIWDAVKGKEMRQLNGPSGPWPLAFSGDGSTLAVGFDNGAVRLWDARTWRAGLTWEGGKSGLWPLAVSPDGRTIATTAWQNGSVRIYETATGQFRDAFDGAGGGGWAVGFTPDGCTVLGVGPTGVTLWNAWSGRTATIKTKVGLSSVACSADGRTLVAGDANGTVHIWDIRDLRKTLTAKDVKLAEKELDEHWTALADTDAARAFRSVRTLVAAPTQTIALVRERLKPVKREKVDEAEVAKLIVQLDSDDFETREKASAVLEKQGPKIAPLLRAALAKTKAAEVRRRLEALLKLWAKKPLTAEELRSVRAIEVLEAIASPESRQLLKKLADGASDSLLTTEAKAALARLTR